MSRRSRNRYRRAGEAYYPSSASTALPRTHEGVRRYQPWGISSASLATPQGFYERFSRRPTVRPIFSLAKPAVGRLSPGRWSALSELQIRAPARARFCVQRKQRKEVLFALRIAGRGAGGHGRYRRTANSAFSC